MLSNYAHISPTAYHVAAVRARGNVPYASKIAQLCDAEKRTVDFFGENGHHVDLSRMQSFMHAMVLRLFSTYAALRKTGIPRVAELASGLSPLGLMSTESIHRTYLETDLRHVTEEKVRLLTKIVPAGRPNLFCTPHDVMSSESWDALIRTLVHDDRPVVFISEGLLMYLSHDERTMLYRHIHRALQVLGGVWITPDFVLKKYVVAGATRSARTREMYDAYVRGTGRDTAASAYETYNAVTSHLGENNLRVHWCLQHELAPDAVPHDVLAKSTYLRDQRVAVITYRSNA